MNSWPTFDAWLQLGAALAIEVSIVWAGAELAARRINSVQWRRTLWQAAFVAILVLFVGELSGVRGVFADRTEETSIAKRVPVTVTTSDLSPEFENAPTVHSLDIVSAIPEPTESLKIGSGKSKWFMAIWLTGMALILARMLTALTATIAFRFAVHRLSIPTILERISRFAQMLRIRRSIAVRESSRVAVPFTFGVVKPVVVLPENFTTTFTREQQDSALLHELAHIANFDSAWRCVANISCALLWWHPLVWLARRELDRASELVADDASTLIPNGRHRLAECLLECAKHAGLPSATSWLGVSGFRSGLGQRVARLLRLESEPARAVSHRCSWCLRLIAPLVVSTLLWMGMTASTSSMWRANAGWHSSVLGALVAAASPAPPRFEVPTSNTIAPIDHDQEIERLGTKQPVSDKADTRADSPQTRKFKLGRSFLQQLAVIQKPATSLLTNRQAPATLDWITDGKQGPNSGFKYVITATSPDGAAIRSLFKTVGVDLNDPNETLLFRDSPASLMVSATASDLDKIEKAIAAIETNQAPVIGDTPHRGRSFRPATRSAGQIAPDVAGAEKATQPLVQSSSARESIYRKLRSIRMSTFGPIDNVPLPDVLRTLSDAARQADPQKEGVNLLISPTANSATAAGSPTLDAAGLPVAAAPEPLDLNTIQVRIGNALHNITLEQALEIITKVADRIIKYSVEDDGVVISHRPIALHTRTFRIDTNTVQRIRAIVGPAVKDNWPLGRDLQPHDDPVRPHPAPPLQPGQVRPIGQGNGIEYLTAVTSTETVIPAFRKYFQMIGVDLSDPGKAVFFNDRLGYLMVRATLQDLDIIEKALQTLSVGPQQLTLQVKAMEVPLEAATQTFLRFGMTNVPTAVAPASQAFTNGPAATLKRILTPEQFQVMLRDLENIGGTDILSAADVTTLSGRQAQIKVVDVRYIVTDLDYDTKNVSAGQPPVPQPITEPFELGPVVDLVPYVEPDGFTIRLSVLPKLREFLGYYESKDLPAVGGPFAPPLTPVPLPKFRLRQVAANARVSDGQTLVLGAGPATSTNGVTKTLYFFVTPRLIDAAGNPLHTDGELTARYGIAPSQR